MEGWLQSTEGFLHYILCYVDVDFFAFDFRTRIYIRLGDMYFLNLFFGDVRVGRGKWDRPVGNSSGEGLGNLSWPLSG
jgi:hypothetical protein